MGTTGELGSDNYFEVALVSGMPFFQPIITKGYVSSREGIQEEGPEEGIQDGMLGHVVGILRAWLTMGHEAVDGDEE
eukprot:12437619-Prorocentrum_lima.AAC.1